MEKKFESWSQLPAPATAAADVKKAAGAVTVSLPPAVAAFEVKVDFMKISLYYLNVSLVFYEANPLLVQSLDSSSP